MKKWGLAWIRVHSSNSPSSTWGSFEEKTSILTRKGSIAMTTLPKMSSIVENSTASPIAYMAKPG